MSVGPTSEAWLTYQRPDLKVKRLPLTCHLYIANSSSSTGWSTWKRIGKWIWEELAGRVIKIYYIYLYNSLILKLLYYIKKEVLHESMGEGDRDS